MTLLRRRVSSIVCCLPYPHMVDNGTGSVKASERYGPPLQIFKVYIITIMGHLNIPLLSLLYRQKTDLPQDSMTPLSPFPMWNFLFFHMKDAFFFLLRCRRCPRTSSRIAYTSHLEGWPSLQKFFSASAHPALVRFSSSLPLSFSWRNSVLDYNPTKV